MGSLPEILQFFAYEHLTSDYLKSVSQPFGEAARKLVASVADSAERSAALRRLLEAKDAAVRAAVLTQKQQ